MLCKRDLHKNYFIYVDNQKETTKIVHIDKNEVIRVYFKADEKKKIEENLIEWKKYV